ncbi:hypothetical protein [Geopsychrobacter electrodiphilus]|uniref:hypothetical protein n=1 Tax=Geopsychrobacter electrodiphilus TaxID=225196 RepID=UPI000379123C|nr:hypothetical protein [Geopsychrobacter electrodiphilus]
MPAKVTATEIIEMGFSPEMFGSNTAGFPAFLTSVITEQSEILAGRVGATAYDSTTAPTRTYVKRAEKCLICAELFQRRFVRIAQDIKLGDGIDAFKLRRTQEKFEADAEMWISKIASGTTTDGTGFSSGVAISSHFDGDA